MNFDSKNFGPEGVSLEDRAYNGSRSSEVWAALLANPYYHTWGKPGDSPLPVCDVTLGRALSGLFPWPKRWRFPKAALSIGRALKSPQKFHHILLYKSRFLADLIPLCKVINAVRNMCETFGFTKFTKVGALIGGCAHRTRPEPDSVNGNIRTRAKRSVLSKSYMFSM
jgi:hypothetical protein